MREWAADWDVPTLEVHDTIGSTNDRARTLADHGADEFTTVLADEQTAGRGRGGKTWVSAPGAGLWLSLVLPRASTGGHLPLLLGLAAARAVERQTAVPIGIKWPNDLVVGGRKLGGILCEARGNVVVAGIGINVRPPQGGFPAELSGAVTSLEQETALEGETVLEASRAGLAGAIIDQARRIVRIGTEGIPEQLLDELRSRDILRDRAVDTDQEGAGVARGIECDGALRVELDGGRTARVVAGSVHFV